MINRTRRRDIQDFCVRRSHTISVPMSMVQAELHRNLLEFEEEALRIMHGDRGILFMTSTIRRQAASCIFGLAPCIRAMIDFRFNQLEGDDLEGILRKTLIKMPQALIEKAKELERTIPGGIILGQFDNPANPAAHAAATGPEIWEDTDGQVDIFVAGVGTGGTITGIGTYLKAKNPAIKIVAVEPADSAVLSGGAPGPHKLQGIGAGFIPSVLNTGVYDEIITVTTEEAYEAGRKIACKEGILVGITSGAALYAAAQLAKRPENAGKTIVALLPDSGDRYLYTPMFAEE